VEQLLAAVELPEAVEAAMLTVLRQHPDETRWCGQSGKTLFAMAAQRLPGGRIRRRSTPAMVQAAHKLAVLELLKAKSLLDRYAEKGLTDATTLRQAVVQASGELRISGQARGVTNEASAQGDYAAAYVTADEATLSAYLLQPEELEKVQVAYREVMHRQARQLMERSNWSDALLMWHHLHKRKLVSQRLYLDAARCFKELGRNEDLVQVVTEAIDTFADSASVQFLEEAGDLVLPIETEPAQALAEKAYTMASDLLLRTVTPPVAAEKSGQP
jgi:hypothetical protein